MEFGDGTALFKPAEEASQPEPVLRFARPLVSREATVLINTEEHFGVGYVTNVSFDGAFIATPMVLQPGTKFLLSIEIAGVDKRFETRAEVVWHNPPSRPVARELPTGYEIRFNAVSERELAEVHELISELLALGSGDPHDESVPSTD